MITDESYVLGHVGKISDLVQNREETNFERLPKGKVSLLFGFRNVIK